MRPSTGQYKAGEPEAGKEEDVSQRQAPYEVKARESTTLREENVQKEVFIGPVRGLTEAEDQGKPEAVEQVECRLLL